MKSTTTTSLVSSLLILFTCTFLLTACEGEKAPSEERSGYNDATEKPAGNAEENAEEGSADDETTEKDDKPKIDIASLPRIATPKGYREIGTADGDLDKDGTPERVIIFDTGNPTDMGTEREIRIYRAAADEWQLWHSSIGAVMPSEHGGAMGEPFRSVDVERGAIVLKHSGGSRAKWAHTPRYRFQDGAFHLIGTTTTTDIPNDVSDEFDYNLSTGRATYKKTQFDPVAGKMSETLVVDEVLALEKKKHPKMDGFRPGEQTIDLPGIEDRVTY